jgi:riboflavin synthase
MFTGIITDVGTVQRRELASNRKDTRMEILTSFPLEVLKLGNSIACDGVCLTVVAAGEGENGKCWFAVDASGETLSRTTLEQWQEGTPVNLEAALKLGDELGGHLVSGHVDAVAEVESVAAEGGSWRVFIRVPESLQYFIAEKGSVTINGVSLTVNKVAGNRFGVNLIPHTWQHTNLHRLEAGSLVNLEIDLIARYLARMQEGMQKAG